MLELEQFRRRKVVLYKLRFFTVVQIFLLRIAMSKISFLFKKRRGDSVVSECRFCCMYLMALWELFFPKHVKTFHVFTFLNSK
jgi:hypothetical protein